MKKIKFFSKKIRTQTVLSGERVKITRRRRKEKEDFLA
ncbi:hypothetical protein LEP1GSC021_3025 [Leptospira noguchii str. 1993005606]|uniref:Uncharacterized protein n=1 Tax=Leptospira noguchii str. 2007001578 TaxID=1049974 RepID=A0ABP2T3R1_9LEPT|nr:hypothetical protein LEP1GSC035_4800 [Leptospira noguchii str. 2007001578]EPE86111.1 hypothetical protein LEP1GSC021_3025 [Leptospira noguchii str. 1993005606]